MDTDLWNHVNSLEEICKEDSIRTKIRDFRTYNGIIEFNGKFILRSPYFDQEDITFLFFTSRKI